MGERPHRHEQDVFIEQQEPDWGAFKTRKDGYARRGTWPQRPPPEAAEAAVTAPVRTVVSADGWKYNHSALGEHKLYHPATDPAQRSRLESLRGCIEAWRRETQDTAHLHA